MSHTAWEPERLLWTWYVLSRVDTMDGLALTVPETPLNEPGHVKGNRPGGAGAASVGHRGSGLGWPNAELKEASWILS